VHLPAGCELHEALFIISRIISLAAHAFAHFPAPSCLCCLQGGLHEGKYDTPLQMLEDVKLVSSWASG